jgi:broad specificity phosphatase PhoE
MRRFVFATLLSCGLASVFPAHAQEVIYLIRHAEKEASGTDPRLTPAGRERAVAWAEMFRHSEIDVILTTDAQRTRETGGIISRSLGAPREELPREDIARLIDLLQFDHADDTVLIVGHAETIPSVLSNLGVFDTIEISQTDYANLFVLTTGSGDEPSLVRLRMP